MRTRKKPCPVPTSEDRHAVVTRYPTGCFGIDHRGSMFFWWGFGEDTVIAKLEELGIPPWNIVWEEKYYDRRFDFGDRRVYRTRLFVPDNPAYRTNAAGSNTNKRKAHN